MRSEKKYSEDPILRHYIRSDKLVVEYTASGWTTAGLMKKYVSWLRDQVGGRICYLLWDLHRSQRDAAVKQKAHDEQVNLSYIPARQTGEWQPLGRRIFGQLKAVSRRQLDEICVDVDLGTLDIADALVVLMESWDAIRQNDIRNVWVHLFIADDPGEEGVAEDGEGDDRSLADDSESDTIEEEEEYNWESDEFAEDLAELPSDLDEDR